MGEMVHGDVVGRILERLEMLEAENSRLAAELRALRSPQRAPGCDDDHREKLGAGGIALSRRHALKALSGAAAGVGLIVASGAVRPEAASATDPNDIAMGLTNDAGSGLTSIHNSAANFTCFAAQNTADGTGLWGIAESPSGIFQLAGVVGDTNKAGGNGVAGIASAGTGVMGISKAPSGLLGTVAGTAGVVGDSNTGPGVLGCASTPNGGTNGSNCGVIGVSNVNAGVHGVGQGTNNPGVWGVGAPGVLGKGTNDGDTGVAGESVTGAGVSGSGAIGVDGSGSTGVHGGSLGSGTGVHATITGQAATVGLPQITATGTALLAEVLDGGGGPPTAGSVAVAATNQGLGTAVKATSTSGIGVSAQGGLAPLRLVPSASVAGPSTTGAHSQGEVFVDKNGVQWLCTASGDFSTTTHPVFVRVITSGVNAAPANGAGVQVNESGTGHALVGNVANNASAGLGVYGLTNGSGQGVRGYNSGTGIGVYGQINNTANANPAVYANTNGKGYGVLGNINNTANSSAAVRGVTNGTGPALQGVGGRAQLNLAPSSLATHPGSGQKGDLFLDSSARLWLCTVGGSSATWKQVLVA